MVDDDGRCVAIIARQDLLEATSELTAPAIEQASREVITVSPDDTLRVALRRMLEEDVGHLPVVADGRLVGMCTRTDILRARRRKLEDEHLQPGWRRAARAHLQPSRRVGAVVTGKGNGNGRAAHRCLVVANQTLGGPELREAIKGRMRAGHLRFYVLVPATRAPDLYRQVLGAYEGEAPDDDVALRQARSRLDRAVAWIRDAGAEAEGEIGDPHPMIAVRDVMSRIPVDDVIVSTLPVHLSRWLRMDLTAKVERETDLPVTHVVGPPPA
jgi:hypothetical protein